MEAIGKKVWAIAEGYIPPFGTGPEPEFTSHEAACMLNTSDEDAHVEIILFFEDKEPIGPYHITIPARRTLHLRFNNLKDPAPVPRGTGYASVIVSNVPIVVQHTRLDSRQAANALISAIAYPAS
ncbi:sensory rhodopsin transducer [Mucilaginibacter robiniae]|uniref:Sensory rhodopsin transducer n=1 Tax=Mucilaginibacter robiniae TaxID=2728022 RepID=A0A7L5DUJ7_9SPHI|nr:sensory rhodopsin transducer [Mucilaginibacter robiniae]QJD94780.1 sensory rhodopsin transducer [Mucilaginibacter robiniae]